MNQKIETVVFGGGCFWCTEAVFEQLSGVISVMPGYAGGNIPNPTYPMVCTGRTGHAEVIEVKYDPAQISFDDLLTVFFGTHDPTTLNRQGADIGTEYRSIILFTTDRQKAEAERFIKELGETDFKGRPITTELKALSKFYPAENYHKEYFRNNSSAPYCQFVIAPKVTKFQKHFAELLNSSRQAAAK
ncbi:MAG TPA: peptide-methionine (S)-S-oxide reductase MsrA [Candidatus Binataceae bacterium]|nr:peptide-methionine (S)-S-oxide reductase MsrA [Candidatus Binataceae bacterium]